MPNYVVIARFDEETDSKLTALRERLASAGHERAISEWPPHITLAAYETAELEEILRWTRRFAEGQARVPVGLSALSILPPWGVHTDTAVLCAAPSYSPDLIEMYYGFHRELDEHCGGLGWWYSMKFGFPVLHSTIGIFEIACLQEAMEIVFQHGVFGVANLVALEVYTYPMELIERFELG